MLSLTTALLFPESASAQSKRQWIVLGTAADAVNIEWRLSEAVRARVDAVLPVGNAIAIAKPQALGEHLRATDGQTTFIVTDAEALSASLSVGGWKDLADRGFQLLTPRLWGRVLYVFTRAGELSRPSGRPEGRLGWVYWAGGSESADVITARTKTLLQRFQLENVNFSSLVSARAMAQGLIAGRVDAVAIYEEEPSGFLARFLLELEASQQTFDRLAITDGASSAATAVLDGVALLTLPLGGQQFYVMPRNVQATGTSVVVTPPPSPARGGFQLPIILTNARATKELDRLQAALKSELPTLVHHQYLRVLFEQSVSRCSTSDPVAAEHFKTLLLSTFFSDRKNPFAALGLLGHLDYMRNVRETTARATATPDRRAAMAENFLPERVFERILREENKDLRSTSAEGLVEWLRSRSNSLSQASDLRARYAGHPADQKYVQTVEDLHKSLAETRPAVRQQMLEQTRETFIELAEVTRPTGCGKRLVQRGLWTGTDFEPYFYLIVIDAVLREVAPTR